MAKVDYKSEILPVLEAKCFGCHKAPYEKDGKTISPKAELRLDAAWGMLKGGESQRPALVPGNALKSFMFEVVTLPQDADKFMPKKGDPFTPAELDKLKTWINEGANFSGWEGNLAGKPVDAPSGHPVPHEREHDVLYHRLAEGLSAPSEETLKKLKEETGAQISPLMPGSPLLRVDFLTGVSRCDDKSIESLLAIKDNIAHLDLARTKISNSAMDSIRQLPRLTRLDLRKTAVTDQGIELLAGCKDLTYLNLFGTEVSDAAVGTLSSISSLRYLYVSQTKITGEGIAKLKQALKEAEVVGDLTLPEGKKSQSGERKKNKKKKKD